MATRFAKAHSVESVQRLQDAGWILVTTIAAPGETDPAEYVLEWPHSSEPPYRELSTVKVVKLLVESREYQGTEGLARAPQVGDTGAIVHRHQPQTGVQAYDVECVGRQGETLWLATFQHDELQYAA